MLSRSQVYNCCSPHVEYSFSITMSCDLNSLPVGGGGGGNVSTALYDFDGQEGELSFKVMS